MKFPPIAFDLDGVVADLLPVLADVILDRSGHDIRSLKHDRHQIDVPGWSYKDVADCVQHALLYRQGDVEPMPGSYRLLSEVWEITKLPVTFVTARMPEVMDETYKWLNNHVLHLAPYRVFSMRSSEKAKFLKEKGIKFFVEDRFRTANQVAQVLPACFLLDQDWNRGREPSDNVVRVGTLYELLDILWKLLPAFNGGVNGRG